ncbi:MAG: hypothetical protein Q8L15_09730 [Methylobacter sp.]|nr:hypothetical protein [Methylobacter sp.]
MADKTYAVDTAALYEQWSDPRRVAGGRVSGLQGRVALTPLPDSILKLGVGGERLEYDYLTGKQSSFHPTGSAEYTQNLPGDFQLKMGADAASAQNRYTLGLDRPFGGVGLFGVNLVAIRGRDGAPDDNQIRLAWSHTFGSKLGTTGSGSAAQAWGSLLDQVANRPAFIPVQVVAKLDTTAIPTRLIAVNKAALPAGSSVNTVTGAITTPLGVAVTGIAAVTLNAAPFGNNGQFSLSDNNLITDPGKITLPAVGVTDTYVVTVNNLGGGTTLVTILVSHGSVKIDSINIANGDVTAPTTTAGPSVSGTTGTGTTLSATINENGTGYYLVQAAAAAAPTVAAVQAGTAFAMTANIAASPAISGLTASTAYKIYFVAKDTANNVQAAVQSVAVTTNAAPAAPTASAVSISGTAQVGQVLTGSYTYADANNDPQGTSTFRWLRDGVAIVGATASTYTIVSAGDGGTTITFEVTPVSTIAPTTGTPVVSGATATVPAYVSQAGLTWMPTTGVDGTYAQAAALRAGTINGQTGWRLPTDAELSALYASGAMNGQGWTLGYTWSSTPGGPGHRTVSLGTGSVLGIQDTSVSYMACVR